MNNINELIINLDKLHTTILGEKRIRKNLGLNDGDIVYWCKEKIISNDALITKEGKNWYINVSNCIITVNSHSYTIITAHKIKKKYLEN